jgi:putative iron-regulated protein
MMGERAVSRVDSEVGRRHAPRAGGRPCRGSVAVTVALIGGTLGAGCGAADPTVDALDDAPPVVAGYGTLLSANYEDAVRAAEDADAAYRTLVEAPSEATLRAAREAWIASRLPYLETEVARFYGGPIDAEETGPEDRINAWPMDEAYVDYVVDDAGAVLRVGIVNDAATYPVIDVDALARANLAEGESEDAVAAGYHAIEFLLWGQDLYDDGPGQRPATDFVEGGPDPAAPRRRAYLLAASTLLLSDLRSVRDQWRSDAADSYRRSFEALPPREALTRIFRGMAFLSGVELAGERMAVPLRTADQEDEHSCFSDTTTNDALHDAIGIRNVYLGRYRRVDGTVIEVPSVSSLVAARDPQVDARVRAALQASIAAIEAIPPPFDRAIVDPERRPLVRAAIDALAAQTEALVAAARVLGITANIAR